MADTTERRPSARDGAPQEDRNRPEDTPFVTVGGHVTVLWLIEAEQHVKAALRIIELDPDPDAQREAKILDLAAARIRARRWAA